MRATKRERVSCDARKEGWKVTTHDDGTIDIRKGRKGQRRGLRIYPDGTAVDVSVSPSHQRMLRTEKDWRAVLCLTPRLLAHTDTD